MRSAWSAAKRRSFWVIVGFHTLRLQALAPEAAIFEKTYGQDPPRRARFLARAFGTMAVMAAGFGVVARLSLDASAGSSAAAHRIAQTVPLRSVVFISGRFVPLRSVPSQCVQGR